ncbi:uncharacterized protein EV420DRAFT_1701615, partial [Desarmillaria tabescens]
MWRDTTDKYVERGGLMVGLCFKRYVQTLRDAVENGVILREDIESSLNQIKKGVEHVHGLGKLVLNDNDPSNIILDADGSLVSCLEQRKPIKGKSGTFPFSNESETAELENDFYGIEKTREWI